MCLFLRYIQIGLNHIINVLYLSFLCNVLSDESKHFNPEKHSPEEPVLRAGARGGTESSGRTQEGSRGGNGDTKPQLVGFQPINLKARVTGTKTSREWAENQVVGGLAPSSGCMSELPSSFQGGPELDCDTR